MKPTVSLICSFALFATALAASAAASDSNSEARQVAECVLRGGTVISVDPAIADAEALAIRDRRILAVGSNAEIDALVGDKTEVIELDGATVVPGFIEGHGHFLGFGEAQMILDLQPTTSFDEVVEKVREAVDRAQPGEWILGRGWHQERWQPAPENAFDGVPSHHALSEVSPNNPVLLTHASGHASFANRSALELAGIDRDSINPEGGVIVRDDRGAPTGFLRQSAQMQAREALNRSQQRMTAAEREERFLRQVELAGAAALRHGITSFHDQGLSFADIDRLKRLAEEGKLPIRLQVAVRGESNADMDQRLPEYRLIGHGNGFLTVRSIKRQIDGALGTHGAWLLDPYADMESTSGLPQMPNDVLRETAEIALRHGFQLNTHAIGDRGNREALDVYQAVFESAESDKKLRWRIEHAQNLHPDEVPRFAKLGVIASMQGIHATSDGPWVPQRLGQQRAQQRAYVWRSLLDAGAVICNGTDVPVEPISAIASYHASVTRRMANGERFFPEQAMDRLQALRSYTLDCAYAGFDETHLGSITPGKLADLVVLDRNLLTVDEAQIADAQVKMTLIDGEVRYRQ